MLTAVIASRSHNNRNVSLEILPDTLTPFGRTSLPHNLAIRRPIVPFTFPPGSTRSTAASPGNWWLDSRKAVERRETVYFKRVFSARRILYESAQRLRFKPDSAVSSQEL